MSAGGIVAAAVVRAADFRKERRLRDMDCVLSGKVG